MFDQIHKRLLSKTLHNFNDPILNGSVSVALDERKLKCEYVSQTSRITYCTTSSMIVKQKSLLLVCILMVKGLFCSAQSVCDVLKHTVEKKVKSLLIAKMVVKALNEPTNPNTTWLCQCIHSAARLSAVLRTQR